VARWARASATPVHKADNRGVLRRIVQVDVLFVPLIEHLKRRRFLVQRIEGVGAHPQFFLHQTTDGLARRQNGRDIFARQHPQRIEPLRFKQTADGHLDRAIDPAQGQHFVLEQHTSRELRQQLTIEFQVFQIRERKVILFRQPLEDFGLALDVLDLVSFQLLSQSVRVHGRDLLVPDHGFEQLGHGFTHAHGSCLIPV
jgi:hypothetical protein